MNLYEQCKKCGNKHPSVYKDSFCLDCRITTVTWQDICNKVKEENDG